MANDIRDTKLVKELAANDKPTRDRALLSLQTYLSSARALTPLDYLKLHSGLFYCMWMCDRPLPQQSLASSLASLVLSLPKNKIVGFYRGFWEIMKKEWERIDVLRMEKFLLLVRRYVAVGLEVVRDNWTGEEEEENVGEGVLRVVEEIPCRVGEGEMRVPNGMKFHVVDIWVDELERVGMLEEDVVGTEEGKAKLERVLRPLKKMQKDSMNKIVRNKAKDALADERLPGNEKDAHSDKDEDEDEAGNGWGGIED
ncbi:nucleolar, Nop52 protein [Rutstroemia sp. NJR-2017a WRK4]|nr:nucleolar, Nop52 protein [Rutstroemia sp. NJR-2017a WRK4]